MAFSRFLSPFRRSSQATSIRRQLLGLSLLAVLGGYVLLIVATALLASQERLDQHRSTAATLRQVLLSRRPVPGTLDAISNALAQLISPNVLAWLETDQGVPYGVADQIRLFTIPTGVSLASLPPTSGAGQVAVVRVGQRTYLISSQPIQLGQRSVRLRFLEDITPKLAQQRRLLILLVAAAGIASLFKGLLLASAAAGSLPPGRSRPAHAGDQHRHPRQPAGAGGGPAQGAGADRPGLQ